MLANDQEMEITMAAQCIFRTRTRTPQMVRAPPQGGGVQYCNPPHSQDWLVRRTEAGCNAVKNWLAHRRTEAMLPGREFQLSTDSATTHVIGAEIGQNLRSPWMRPIMQKTGWSAAQRQPHRGEVARERIQNLSTLHLVVQQLIQSRRSFMCLALRSAETSEVLGLRPTGFPLGPPLTDGLCDGLCDRAWSNTRSHLGDISTPTTPFC